MFQGGRLSDFGPEVGPPPGHLRAAQGDFATPYRLRWCAHARSARIGLPSSLRDDANLLVSGYAFFCVSPLSTHTYHLSLSQLQRHTLYPTASGCLMHAIQICLGALEVLDSLFCTQSCLAQAALFLEVTAQRGVKRGFTISKKRDLRCNYLFPACSTALPLERPYALSSASLFPP